MAGEIRIPKYETRNNTEYRKGEMKETPNEVTSASSSFWSFEPSDFEFVSDFDIRISDLRHEDLLQRDLGAEQK